MKRGNFGAIPTRDIFLEFEHHGPIKFLLKKRVYGTPWIGDFGSKFERKLVYILMK